MGAVAAIVFFWSSVPNPAIVSYHPGFSVFSITQVVSLKWPSLYLYSSTTQTQTHKTILALRGCPKTVLTPASPSLPG